MDRSTPATQTPQQATAFDRLPGEGDTKVAIETRTRRDCDNCGEPATKRIAFCFENGRRNPASSMYGRDDCTYCSDSDAYACTACEREVRRACCPNGMEWASTMTCATSNAHLFLFWQSRDLNAAEAAAVHAVLGGAA